MGTRTYPFSAFATQRVANDILKTEIEGSSIATPVERIDTVGTDCTIYFNGEPTAGEDTTLDGLVAAHTAVRTEVKFHVATAIVSKSLTVTETTTWQEVGGAVTNPGFFAPNNLDRSQGAGLFARIIGQIKTTGTGAQMRLVENDGSTDSILGSFDCPDTVGAFQKFEFDTTVTFRASDNSYRLEARLNGATAFELRFIQGAFIEVIIL